MVLQVLSTWNFDVLGHELTACDIKALDSYMKRCKLGPFRLGRALELLSDPSHEAREELESLRSKARRRLEGLKHIQRVRMNRLDVNPDEEGPAFGSQFALPLPILKVMCPGSLDSSCGKRQQLPHFETLKR
ncbi:Dhrs13 [Symbiodinium natans]|uniref:Dhrs13 protein n=1 Tax=Symbiodinium natans TaxID=878477 RepID=A0A812PS64_9DINO|nr:Dhrs13 [Symbiodinium natans]